MDSTGHHLLALKVMRVSRPALASAWEPFYSSSPSFSARSTASIVSLQGKDPLSGHPKTLRDLSNASELLTLPSSFGAIQLGETFSSCLSVNNEAGFDVSRVILKVEMQTATTKIPLAEALAGSDGVLKAGDTMESIVHHEIKELGQHVLACTVSYRFPPDIRRPPLGSEDENDPELLTFRKFYKFAVTNPLSVKTKVHIPRSPSALLSAVERDKVFLEVHIQNLTQDALWFQRIVFECAEGWDVVDVNSGDADNSQDAALFSGTMALMQPQDTRQYIYIFSPKELSSFHVAPAPGSNILLGRLDICWRSSFGEPGRLLTSMLSRRIPLIASAVSSSALGPPAKGPISALPLHMRRSASVGPGSGPPPRSSVPLRSQTPPMSFHPQSPGTVPQRPGSPFRSRTLVHSPPPPPPPPAAPAQQLPISDVEVDLTVHGFSHGSVSVETPFEIPLKVTISAPVPPTRTRNILLVAQHVLPPHAEPAVPIPVSPVAKVAMSGRSSPSPTGSPLGGDFLDSLTKRLLVASPRVMYMDDVDDEMLGRTGNSIILPPPFATQPSGKSGGIRFLGSSAVILGPIMLKDYGNGDVAGSHEFSLKYMAIQKGFSSIGGLRVILIGDHLDGDETKKLEAVVLKEWDVIAEVWVQ